LSRESSKVAEAETVSNVEGNMCGTVRRGAVALPWSKTASRRKGLRWNPGFRRGRLWEISRPAGRRAAAPVRVGKAEEAVADDERTSEVGPLHSSGELCEQSWATGGGSGGAKGGGQGERGPDRRLSRTGVSPGLDRVRQAAKAGRETRFTALLHHLDVALLRWAYSHLKRDAAVGVDEVIWAEYGQGQEARLPDRHGRVHRGAYRAQPSRRHYLPKPDGRARPLGIAALENKIVQRALVAILNAIYEEGFLGFSFGFRPGRGQHARSTRWSWRLRAAR
jgi:hypothetical protein